MFLFDKRPCLQLEALVRSVICSWRGDFTKSLHKFFKLMAWPTSGHLERDWWWGCLWSPDICDLPYADIPTGRALSPTLWWWGISNLPWRVAYLRQNNSEQVSQGKRLYYLSFWKQINFGQNSRFGLDILLFDMPIYLVGSSQLDEVDEPYWWRKSLHRS